MTRFCSTHRFFVLLLSMSLAACASQVAPAASPIAAQGEGCQVEIRNGTEFPLTMRYAVHGQPPTPLGEILAHQSHHVVVDCGAETVVVHAVAKALENRTSRGGRYKQVRGKPSPGETVVLTVR